MNTLYSMTTSKYTIAVGRSHSHTFQEGGMRRRIFEIPSHDSRRLACLTCMPGPNIRDKRLVRRRSDSLNCSDSKPCYFTTQESTNLLAASNLAVKAFRTSTFN